MKIIFCALLVMLSIEIVDADIFQSPRTLTCTTTNGITVCPDLPYTWKVKTNDTFNEGKTIQYMAGYALFDSKNTTFNNIEYFYYISTGGILSIERAFGAPTVYPDFSDSWGWSWQDINKITAYCGSNTACALTTTPPSNS